MAMDEVTASNFEQEFSKRNGDLKERIAQDHIRTIKASLEKQPFCYPERMAKNVSEGIVMFGDKLMSNVEVDSDDDEEKMEELNQIGQEFQAIVNVTALILETGEDCTEKNKILDECYPMPRLAIHKNKAKVTTFIGFLEKMKTFLTKRAFLGVSALIALVGECNEDGVVFGTDQTIPVEVLEHQIQNALRDLVKQVTPTAVDLAVFKNGKLEVSTILRSGETIHRLCIHKA